MATALSSLLEDWQAKQESARLSNIKRSEQITSIYDEIIRRYEPGGTFGKGALGQLEKQKVRDVGGEMQQMISSGLYGTTTAAGAGRRWEESVGAPGRLRLEDIMMQRLSQAQVGKAGFMERIEEPYPDYAMMAGLTQQAAAGPRTPFQSQPTQRAPRQSLAQFMRGFDVRGGRGGGGGGYGAGQSPLQLRLAEQNRARAAAERERKSQATPPISPEVSPTAGTGISPPTTQQPAGVPTSLATGAQMSRMISPVPTTASLMSRYDRWKRQFKRTNPNIGESSIASYQDWYRANIAR